MKFSLVSLLELVSGFENGDTAFCQIEHAEILAVVTNVYLLPKFNWSHASDDFGLLSYPFATSEVLRKMPES